jgi:hypothetical protein
LLELLESESSENVSEENILLPVLPPLPVPLLFDPPLLLLDVVAPLLLLLLKKVREGRCRDIDELSLSVDFGLPIPEEWA